MTGNLLSFVQLTNRFARRRQERECSIHASLLRVQYNAVRVCRKDILKDILERDRVSSELCVLNLQNDLECGCQAVVHVLPRPIGSVPSVAEVPLNSVA